MRSFFGVLIGYIANVAAMFVMFTAVWFIPRPNGAFEPGSWIVSPGWSMATVAIWLIAGGIGGRVCAAISENAIAVLSLCVLILSIGLLMGSSVLFPAPSEVRPENVELMTAMQKARNPMWLSLVAPLAGALGAYFGSVRRATTESVRIG